MLKNSIFNKYNVRIKDYGSFKKITYFKNVQSRLMLLNNVPRGTFVITEEKRKEYRRQALSRAKNNIEDYILCNVFDIFFTLTFDEKRHFDYDKSFNSTINWFKNVSRHFDFKYLFVFEEHKKGGLHVHGVCNYDNYLLIKKNNFDYYFIDRWKFGFSNCSYIKDKTKVAKYVSKYITKDCYTYNRKSYFHSQNLKKPIITEKLYRGLKYIYNDNFDYQDHYKKIFLEK